MPNQYKNKVVYFGDTLIDLSGDTLDPSKVLQGYTGHDATGAPFTGTYIPPSGAISVVDTSDSHGGTVRTITAVDISDTTAVASDVASGKYFYTAGGTKTAGTASGGGGGPNDWLGAGTISIGEVFSETINLAEDTSYNDWTASTTAGTILAAPSGYDVEYAIPDIEDYDYSLLVTFDTEVAYKQGTASVSIVKRFCYSGLGQWSMYCSNINAVESGTPNTLTSAGIYSMYFARYYNSSGVETMAVSSYGPMYATNIGTTTDTTKSGVRYLRWKRPAFNARCSATYFATTQKENVDSDNTNMVIKGYLYKTPKTSYRKTYDILADLLRD